MEVSHVHVRKKNIYETIRTLGKARGGGGGLAECFFIATCIGFIEVSYNSTMVWA